LQFIQAESASSLQDPVTKSTAVNMNDYVQSVYFYSADTLLGAVDYTVSLTTVSGSVLDQGTATYDSVTKRLIFSATSPIDMTLAQVLTFTPVQ
jgi:hypothetical protein